ncbi:MAG: hypothetical protein SGJ02_12830 [bacterium]|nr:hypothetical protein [bacterium]
MLPEFDQKHPSDAVFESAPDINGKIKTLASFTHEFLAPGGLFCNVWKNEQAAWLVSSIVPDLQKISYPSYRTLTGYFNTMRNPESNYLGMSEVTAEIERNPHYTQDLKDIARSLLQLRNLLCSGKEEINLSVNLQSNLAIDNPKGLSDEEFATSSLIFLRAVCPKGVNLINADWNLQNPVAILSSKTIQITSGSAIRVSDGIIRSEHFELSSSGDRQEKTDLFFKNSYNPKPVFCGSLQSGESIIFGRALMEKTFYGQPWSLQKNKTEFPLFFIPTGSEVVPINPRESWSRAAIMASRIGDNIYLTDRGHYHKLHVAVGGRAFAEYQPKPKKLDDGSVSFGESTLF